ncbi:MAG: histidine kinase N-terminal 7TM domain-containing protein [Salinibacter sp.]|uniref:sensor histidine kinase n=1 Tax=Salinibacter sp. TaxID=2065818 RepID=UPI0035D51354
MVLPAYRFLLVLACVLGCWVAYQAWTNRETTGARLLVGVALAAVFWAGASLGLTLATAPSVEFRWFQVMYLGIVGAPISFFALALKYTGSQQYLTPTTMGILIAGGCVFLGMAWTNPYHQWYWAEIDYSAAVPTGAATTPAPGFWGFVVFTYVLLLVGTVLFVRYALTAPHLYRSQTIAILIGVGAPWAANIPYSLQWMAADYTPVALAVTTVTLWAAMFRYRLTDIGPVALRTVFESISTGVYVLDRYDRLVDVNAAGRALLDVPDDAIGTPFHTLAPTEAFAEHVRAATDQTKVLVLDDQQPDAEATGPRYYKVQVTPIDPSSGGREGRIVVVNDVTEQRRQQRQLEDQNERLENFTSVVSHDLRNPLNVASGNLTLAQEDCDSDFLNRAEQALARMETLIDDLLALAYGGTTVTEPERVGLAAVAADAWNTVDTKDATLADQTESEIIADRSRLHQLIENLVRNAIEHGGETVTVTIGDRDGGFYVADDGPGIAADDREDVFEMGYSTREDGTGFGLNIVGEIADAHGWEVHVTESIDGGARFDIRGVEVCESSPNES